MTDPKPNEALKKQQKMNLDQLYKDRAAANEKQWLKGNRTAMEQNIIDAGRKKAK